MEQEIINFFTKTTYDQWDYIKIKDENILKIVYKLLIDDDEDFIKEEFIIDNPILCYYYGIYYQNNCNKKYMKKIL